MRRMSKDLNEKSESVQYTVFEAMQTIMDYIEESFENVMLPCTPGKALEGQGGFSVTVRPWDARFLGNEKTSAAQKRVT